MSDGAVYGVADFVAYVNQTLEYAYSYVTIQGEISNYRVSKGKWVYFDLKDDEASVRFFGTVYALPGPLEDGMVVRVSGTPRLHPQFGFSVTFQTIQPVGEGSIRQAAQLLQAKLAAEGLFDPERKRPLPYPPRVIGLITSGESAAYHDFIKILRARWAGVTVLHADVQVQGEAAVEQIVRAVQAFNDKPGDVELLVITRGGGSADDLAAFSTEQVTRAVAGSRIPTLVAVGHEVDISLAELAADQRASTPSNAAELLVPDKRVELDALVRLRSELDDQLVRMCSERAELLVQQRQLLDQGLQAAFAVATRQLDVARQLLTAYDPTAALRRGYALVRRGDTVVRSVQSVSVGDAVALQLHDGIATATITGKE